MKKFMPHTRDEVPLRICSEKVKNHGSTSRVRSLAKRMNRLIATKEKTHLKHHTEISGIKPSCTKKFPETKNLMQEEIAIGTVVLND